MNINPSTKYLLVQQLFEALEELDFFESSTILYALLGRFELTEKLKKGYGTLKK